jgi:hypothetical protein
MTDCSHCSHWLGGTGNSQTLREIKPCSHCSYCSYSVYRGYWIEEGNLPHALREPSRNNPEHPEHWEHFGWIAAEPATSNSIAPEVRAELSCSANAVADTVVFGRVHGIEHRTHGGVITALRGSEVRSQSSSAAKARLFAHVGYPLRRSRLHQTSEAKRAVRLSVASSDSSAAMRQARTRTASLHERGHRNEGVSHGQ